VVIDRCLVDAAGDRWVIDFKTSFHSGGGLDEFLERELLRYAPQLRLYAALASRLGPQRVRAALYFPWLGEFRELDPALL
jgi:ATP-dependent exoDNAse (exonuclease V) beta subunit